MLKLDSSISLIALVVAVASVVGGAAGYFAAKPEGGPPGPSGPPGPAGATGLDVPIGTITAWHPNAAKEPLPLPDGWKRCDGQPISLPEGNPLADDNGVFKLPNLNGTPGRFLRGGSKSGVPQSQDWKSFSVAGFTLGTYTHEDVLVPKQGFNTVFPFGGAWGAADGRANRLRFKFDDSEVRPFNMSVVWIMKVE